MPAPGSPTHRVIERLSCAPVQRPIASAGSGVGVGFGVAAAVGLAVGGAVGVGAAVKVDTAAGVGGTSVEDGPAVAEGATVGVAADVEQPATAIARQTMTAMRRQRHAAPKGSPLAAPNIRPDMPLLRAGPLPAVALGRVARRHRRILAAAVQRKPKPGPTAWSAQRPIRRPGHGSPAESQDLVARPTSYTGGFVCCVPRREEVPGRRGLRIGVHRVGPTIVIAQAPNAG